MLLEHQEHIGKTPVASGELCSQGAFRLTPHSTNVCCTQTPGRTYRLPCGVTSLDFSTEHPHLLAVGVVSGDLFVFDVCSEASKPLVDTR